MNVAVKPWRCHLSAGSHGWDAERGLCSTWMHGRVLSARLLTQASLHFNLSCSTETWSVPRPQTQYLYKSQLLLTLPLKVTITITLLFCTYTVPFNREGWKLGPYFAPFDMYLKSWHRTAPCGKTKIHKYNLHTPTYFLGWLVRQ